MQIQSAHKVLICVALTSLCLASVVEPLGVGPLNIGLSAEKGKETELVQYVQVTNPDTNPISVTASVTGSVGQFISIEPSEFVLTAGPGIHSLDPRPVHNVKIVVKVPREVEETLYTGEILFTQRPLEGGVMSASAQLGVGVTLTIGKMAEVVFPTFINGMILLLAALLIMPMFTRKKGWLK